MLDLARYQSCLAGLNTSCFHLGDVGSPPAAKFGRREISEILWKATLKPKSLTHSLTHSLEGPFSNISYNTNHSNGYTSPYRYDCYDEEFLSLL